MGARPSSRSGKGAKDEDDRDDVKRQIDGDSTGAVKAIYQLVDVKTGGGKLIELIKTRARQQSGSFSSSLRQDSNSIEQQQQQASIDKQICALVEPLLYNGGRGKLVPLTRLWSYRLGQLSQDDESEGDVSWKGQATANRQQQTATRSRYRRVCWKLEERGFVGETALHICFLLSTPSHMILAQKLLEMFPMLINDIYTCDEYFGESSLHMAIVNEDVRIVRLLLDHGANVHERCLGSFFLPHDQKAKLNQKVRKLLQLARHSARGDGLANGRLDHLRQIDLQSNHFNSLKTNYEAYTYWGEYPLSFAASLGLADCYRLLLAKGANPNRRDSNGNSTLHICVIVDRLQMFDLCYATGADLDSLNKLGLSPLSLAAHLRRVQMFFHILSIQRQVSWLFSNVAFLDYPLKGIDSINTQTGACHDQSLLGLVVSGSSNEHLQMLDGLLADLLQVKWDTSLKRCFYAWLGKFMVLLAIASLAYITRFHKEDARRADLAKIKLVNRASETLLICCVLYFLLLLVKRCHFDQAAALSAQATTPTAGDEPVRESSRLVKVLAQTPELALFTLTCLLILLCVPFRWLAYSELENSLASIIMFLLPLTLLFFCRGSKSLGSFIVMIYRIIVKDLLCFYTIFIIFICGFGQSFVIIFKTYRPRVDLAAAPPQQTNEQPAPSISSQFESIARGDNYLMNMFDVYVTMVIMANSEFTWVLDEFHATAYPSLAKVLLCVYMILVAILLVNMLIAMLGNTYQDISSQPNENLRQWARALLTLERICSRSARLAMLDKYSHFVEAQHCRCYSSTWALKDSELQEINAVKELKRDQARNAQRLRDRIKRHNQNNSSTLVSKQTSSC